MVIPTKQKKKNNRLYSDNIFQEMRRKSMKLLKTCNKGTEWIHGVRQESIETKPTDLSQNSETPLTPNLLGALDLYDFFQNAMSGNDRQYLTHNTTTQSRIWKDYYGRKGCIYNGKRTNLEISSNIKSTFSAKIRFSSAIPPRAVLWYCRLHPLLHS